MQAVILAAGRGKRLHPITANRTKAMAPILGKPIVERVMDTFTENGVAHFVLVISPDDSEIRNYFKFESKIDAEVILVEQKEPLGMGHALKQARPHIRGDFFLSACDNLVNPAEIKGMLSTWKMDAPEAILTTLRVGPEDIVRMGIVALDGERIIRIIEKPSLDEAPSNIGSVPLYTFSQRFLTYLDEIKPSPRGEYELQDAIQVLINLGGWVCSHQLSGRIDLTTPKDLLRLNLKYFKEIDSQHELILAEVGKGTFFTQPVLIEENVSIGANCRIGPNVYIEPGCTINDNVDLTNVIVLRNRVVPSGSVENQKIIYE